MTAPIRLAWSRYLSCVAPSPRLMTHFVPTDSVRTLCGRVVGMRRWKFRVDEVTCRGCLIVAAAAGWTESKSSTELPWASRTSMRGAA
jgi:hypothetical protein